MWGAAGVLSEGPSRDDELSVASDTPSSLGQERLIMVANMLPLLAERDVDTQVRGPQVHPWYLAVRGVAPPVPRMLSPCATNVSPPCGPPWCPETQLGGPADYTPVPMAHPRCTRSVP